jgi:hypothetical protein
MSPRLKSSDSSSLVFIALTMSTVAGNGSRATCMSYILIALGIKETIAENYGSSILEVIR